MKKRKMGEERRTQRQENARVLEAVVVAPGRKPRVIELLGGQEDAYAK